MSIEKKNKNTTKTKEAAKSYLRKSRKSTGVFNVGNKTDEEMIAEYISLHGVTKCETMYSDAYEVEMSPKQIVSVEID